MEDKLPETLTIDIFSRLPIKSVISCKSACKKWQSLVADPYFAHLHLSKSRQEALMLLQCPDPIHPNVNNRTTFLKWAEIDEHKHLDTIKSLNLNQCKDPPIAVCSLLFPIGSVNGLVSYTGDKNDSVFIFNPLLEEYIILPPPPPPPPPPPQVTVITLAYGFGVSTAGEYKVIRINLRTVCTNPSDWAVGIEAHTVGTDEWRSLRQTSLNLGWIKGVPLCHNSHLYWEADRCQIYGFDLSSETSELFPAPGDNRDSNRTLGVIKGRLSCVCWSSTGRWEGGVEVWVRDANNWNKEITVESFYFSELWPWRPLCLVDDLEQGGGTSSVLLLYVQVAEADKLVAYCLNTNRILSETPTLWSNCSTIVTYRPSFVKLDKFGSERVQAMYNHNNSQGDLRKECLLAWDEEELEERVLAYT